MSDRAIPGRALRQYRLDDEDVHALLHEFALIDGEPVVGDRVEAVLHQPEINLFRPTSGVVTRRGILTTADPAEVSDLPSSMPSLTSDSSSDEQPAVSRHPRNSFRGRISNDLCTNFSFPTPLAAGEGLGDLTNFSPEFEIVRCPRCGKLHQKGTHRHCSMFNQALFDSSSDLPIRSGAHRPTDILQLDPHVVGEPVLYGRYFHHHGKIPLPTARDTLIGGMCCHVNELHYQMEKVRMAKAHEELSFFDPDPLGSLKSSFLFSEETWYDGSYNFRRGKIMALLNELQELLAFYHPLKQPLTKTYHPEPNFSGRTSIFQNLLRILRRYYIIMRWLQSSRIGDISRRNYSNAYYAFRATCFGLAALIDTSSPETGGVVKLSAFTQSWPE